MSDGINRPGTAEGEHEESEITLPCGDKPYLFRATSRDTGHTVYVPIMTSSGCGEFSTIPASIWCPRCVEGPSYWITLTDGEYTRLVDYYGSHA